MQTVISSSPSTGAPSTGGENVQQQAGAEGKPVVDLLQVYPGKTNNFDILTFQDLNILESRPLCCSSCDLCDLKLRNYDQCMIGFLSAVLIILFIAICILITEIASWYYYYFWYGYSLLIGVLISSFIVKSYVLNKFILFRREKHVNSIEYHRLGNKFYLSFYSDAMFSLVISSWIFLIVINYCLIATIYTGRDYYCNYVTSFEENTFRATLTWLGMIPLLIYSISGYFLVFRDGKKRGESLSDFEIYNKNWSYRRWQNTNNINYVLNYHHKNTLPETHTILCRRVCCCDCPFCHSGNDCDYDTFVCCCLCCNECDGIESNCCCGKDCCSNGVKCSLIAISVWCIFVSIWSLWYLFLFFVYIGWWFFYALEYLWIFLVCGGYHFKPGYYGIQLINYKYKCCKTGNDAIKNSDISFQDYSLKALKSYAALAGFYFYLFGAYLFVYVIPSIFWGYVSFATIVTIFIAAFLSWLPFEAIKLIDTFIKTENYQRNQYVNGNNNNNNNNNGLETGEVQDGVNNISTKKSKSKSKAQAKVQPKVQLQPRQPVMPKFKNNSKIEFYYQNGEIVTALQAASQGRR